MSEISANQPQGRLRPVSGIGLQIAPGNKLVVTLPERQTKVEQLSATSPGYGGVRWWYVCPSCQTRRTTLYLNDNALVCRQCAGIHYASQSTGKIRVADRS
ncbi:hypothetical protein EHW65_20100 [Erwinia psidii]|uniref:hypothetical protein n=1 Tax=Erwinia psidii TaxID=69224 RepID=UPI00226B659D|nr:hypothetical protein [Erwinia psidii]MCX8959453.1 hypothetical protein [Erwinia psidii]